jgi:DNA-binding HxlR family transcriptional regulator
MRQHYGQFCPVAMASEVLAERWTLLVVRELFAGARRFNEIRRGVPRLSPTLLKQRLQTLEKAGIVERQSGAASEPSGKNCAWERCICPGRRGCVANSRVGCC